VNVMECFSDIRNRYKCYLFHFDKDALIND